MQYSRRFNVFLLRGCLIRIWEIVKNVYKVNKPGRKPTQLQTMRILAYDPEGQPVKFVGLYVPPHLINDIKSSLRSYYLNPVNTVGTPLKQKRRFSTKSDFFAHWEREMQKIQTGYEKHLKVLELEKTESVTVAPEDSVPRAPHNLQNPSMWST